MGFSFGNRKDKGNINNANLSVNSNQNTPLDLGFDFGDMSEQGNQQNVSTNNLNVNMNMPNGTGQFTNSVNTGQNFINADMSAETDNSELNGYNYDGTVQPVKKKKSGVVKVIAFLLVVGLGVGGFSYYKNIQDKKNAVPLAPIHQLTDVSELSGVEKQAYNYLELIRESKFDEAYKKLEITNDLFSRSFFQAVPFVKDLSGGEVPDTLYDLTCTDEEVIFLFAEPVENVYSELTKKQKKQGLTETYLGDRITNEYSITVPYAMKNGKAVLMIGAEGLNYDTPIALKVLDKTRVYLYDVLLDERLRDEDGFYLITGYLDLPTVPVCIETDVETLDVELSVTPDDSEYSVEHQAGYTAYDFTHWPVSRQTRADAIDWLKKGMQEAYSSFEKQQSSFLESDLASDFSEKANLEEVKPAYEKSYSSNYVNSAVTKYTDLTIVSVTEIPQELLSRREIEDVFTSGESFDMYVNISYSYYREHYDRASGELESKTIRTGEMEYIKVSLTQDNGVWKFMNIDPKFFRNIT